MACLLLKRYVDLVTKKKIKVTKEYELDLILPEDVNALLRLKNKKEFIDNDVKRCRRKLFKWYIEGCTGYYVVNKHDRNLLFT